MSEAPPPCEAWKGTPDDLILLSRCKVHDRAISQCDLHRQLAEARVVLRAFCYIDYAHVDGKTLADLLEEARRALARSEGGSK